jgi:hypothetical protein
LNETSDQVRTVGGTDEAANAERDALLRQAQQRIVTEQAHGWFLAYKRTPVVVSPSWQATRCRSRTCG